MFNKKYTLSFMRVKHNMQKTLSYCRFGLVKKRENLFAKICVKALRHSTQQSPDSKIKTI
ncbi:hypothetical protein XJ32_08965 [Helicobacter bilis]|uniref:Uncharacterized protein n=1 Tax=Helicobacter bilis TaxID=37372 RepID=A0A1Q2LIG7_9HELI|nr:hypothetical protein [Helicobacter bilis]AQQ60199.1 hypothetical protein XJ32_08965 [Helicobacter bilis]